MNWITIIFWVAVFLFAYTYLGYPLSIWMRARLCARPWIRKDIFPSISIIMPVHNGGEALRDKIRHLLTLDYPFELVEIIVVSDGSDDSTNQVLATISDTRMRTFIIPERQGKAAALNLAMREARGNLLVFVDLRPILEREALRRLVRNFADPRVGCVGGKVVLVRDGHDAASAAIGSFYWRYEQWLRNCEARSGSVLGVYGGFYAIRRELVSELPEDTILDDMYRPLDVVRQGYRVVIDQDARVLDLWPRTSRGEFARKVRTLVGNFQLFRLAPWLLNPRNPVFWRLISHKLLRLCIPALLVLLLLVSWMLHGSAFYLTALILQVAFYVGGMIGLVFDNRITRRTVGLAAAFCLLNGAAIVALWRFLFTREPLWKLWVQPQLGQPLTSPNFSVDQSGTK